MPAAIAGPEKEKGTVEQRCLFKRLETSSCRPTWRGDGVREGTVREERYGYVAGFKLEFTRLPG
jgi:hypothetical protein